MVLDPQSLTPECKIKGYKDKKQPFWYTLIKRFQLGWTRCSKEQWIQRNNFLSSFLYKIKISYFTLYCDQLSTDSSPKVHINPGLFSICGFSIDWTTPQYCMVGQLFYIVHVFLTSNNWILLQEGYNCHTQTLKFAAKNIAHHKFEIRISSSVVWCLFQQVIYSYAKILVSKWHCIILVCTTKPYTSPSCLSMCLKSCTNSWGVGVTDLSFSTGLGDDPTFAVACWRSRCRRRFSRSRESICACRRSWALWLSLCTCRSCSCMEVVKINVKWPQILPRLNADT